MTEIKLGDFCDQSRKITYGIVQPGKESAEGVPIVRVNNFKGHSLDLSEQLRVAPNVEASYQRSRPKPGDLLISLVGSIGQVVVAPPDIQGWNLARAVGLVPFDDIQKAYWAAYAIQLQENQDFIQQRANTTVQATFNLKDLAQIPIPQPGDEIEARALRALRMLDDTIELNRRMNETLEEMARALFRDWFIDFGPTRRQMDGATDPAAIMGHAFPNDKAATLAPLFPARLGEDGLPEGWEDRSLSSVVEQQKKVVKPDQHMNETFEHFSLPAFDKSKWPTLELGAEIKSNKTAIPSNAILVSKLNPRIERIWIPKDVDNHRQICSTEFLCFKPINDFGLATVEVLFRSDGMHEKMASMVTGTSNSHQRVPPKVLMQAEVLLPANIARLFENVTSSFLEKRQVNRRENQILSEIRDLLLPKLMSGEIQLKDAPMVQDTLDGNPQRP